MFCVDASHRYLALPGLWVVNMGLADACQPLSHFPSLGLDAMNDLFPPSLKMDGVEVFTILLCLYVVKAAVLFSPAMCRSVYQTWSEVVSSHVNS